MDEIILNNSKVCCQRQNIIYEDGGNMVCLHMDHLMTMNEKIFQNKEINIKKMVEEGKKLSFAPKGMFRIHGRMNIWKILCAGGHSDFS